MRTVYAAGSHVYEQQQGINAQTDVCASQLPENSSGSCCD